MPTLAPKKKRKESAQWKGRGTPRNPSEALPADLTDPSATMLSGTHGSDGMERAGVRARRNQCATFPGMAPREESSAEGQKNQDGIKVVLVLRTTFIPVPAGPRGCDLAPRNPPYTSHVPVGTDRPISTPVCTLSTPVLPPQHLAS